MRFISFCCCRCLQLIHWTTLNLVQTTYQCSHGIPRIKLAGKSAVLPFPRCMNEFDEEIKYVDCFALITQRGGRRSFAEASPPVERECWCYRALSPSIHVSYH
jgi:hypothetical protein